jgi:hypothetical protein
MIFSRQCAERSRKPQRGMYAWDQYAETPLHNPTTPFINRTIDWLGQISQCQYCSHVVIVPPRNITRGATFIEGNEGNTKERDYFVSNRQKSASDAAL